MTWVFVRWLGWEAFTWACVFWMDLFTELAWLGVRAGCYARDKQEPLAKTLDEW